MGLRLGFHYHIPAEEMPDGIYMAGPQGRFIDGLAAYCDQIVCFLHSSRQNQEWLLDYRLSSRKVTLVDIGRHCSTPKRILNSSHYVSTVAGWRGQLDFFLVRGPSPLLPAFVSFARKNSIPTGLLLVGSYVDGVDGLPQPRWRKELIRVYSHFNQRCQDRAACNSLTFVNSRKLFQYYEGKTSPLVEMRTTTLCASDFYRREDTCLTDPIRMLYVGRYDRAKGLLEIIEAHAALVHKGYDLVLDFVGWDDGNTGVEEEIAALARRLGISDRVQNHGRKMVGEELFAYYRKADIFITASQVNEGFPRTIWEAMANSLPVVATTVGSIPYYLRNNVDAVLIEPGKVGAIAEGVSSLIDNPVLRRSIIANAFETVADNTVEVRSAQMVHEILNYLRSCT